MSDNNQAKIVTVSEEDFETEGFETVNLNPDATEPEGPKRTIHDTDTTKILADVTAMRKEITDNKNGCGPVIMFDDYYQKGYPYLLEYCPKIFEMVLADSFDYMPGLTRMLKDIKIIQSGRKSQNDMDKKTGLDLAHAYIYPHIDRKKEGV